MRAVDHADVEEALLAAMRDPEPWVRYFAAGSLAVHGRERAAVVLSDVAENDDAPQVRIAALLILACAESRRPLGARAANPAAG